jgi:radical SAM protein with 4Fe4S-binding SPASM domain
MFTTYQDGINLIGTLSFRKIWNYTRLITSYQLSKLSGKTIHWGMPASLGIEPTTSCNLRCPECPSGLRSFTRPTGMLAPDNFRTFVDEVHKDLLYLILYFQGEPYLNTAFLDMVKYATEKNIYTATSTNAHYLTDENCKKTVESGLKRMIISIDGTTQDTYASYRIGGNLEKVLEGAKRMVEWKKKLKSPTPVILFQFLVVKPNEHQIEEVMRMGKEIGVDKVLLKTAQIYDYEDGNELIPMLDKYSRYKINPETGKYEIKNNLLNHCWKLWQGAELTWDGRVLPCCFDKDAQHEMGKMPENSFRSIWRGSAYHTFRSQVIKGRAHIDICNNCTEGTRVWG